MYLINKEELLDKFNKLKEEHLHLDISRGKPNKEQLDISLKMNDVLLSTSSYLSKDNIDVRNYGCLDGLNELKDLFYEIGEMSKENTDMVIFGNSSLNIMYECLSDSFIYGIDGNLPFSKLDKVKWLCPAPGYDRHFMMLEHLGIEMINIPMNSDGPDMDLIEEYIKDESVKGIFCVPKYSNPTGITYSKEVVNRLASIKPKAKDFRIYWDNAYAVHDLYSDKKDVLVDIFALAEQYHNEDLIYYFLSTSKMTFPGSGVSSLTSSKRNIEEIKGHLKYKTIGYDKVNMLRHIRYLKDIDNVHLLMNKHADILRDKFDYIINELDKIKDYCEFTRPNGGYFISLYVKGRAKQVIDRCLSCGLKLTEYGSSYPNHYDKDNSHIRIAPSYLSLEELKKAMEILITSILIESGES